MLARGAMVLQIKLREGVIKKKKERERETLSFQTTLRIMIHFKITKGNVHFTNV